MVNYRLLLENDDLDRVTDLFVKTRRAFEEEAGIQVPYKNNFNLKNFSNLFGDKPDAICFVAENQGGICCAALCLDLNNNRSETYVLFGYEEAGIKELSGLLEFASEKILAINKSVMKLYVPVRMGRTWNQTVNLFVKMGFIPDGFTYNLLKLDLEEWKSPEILDISNIQVAKVFERDKVYNLLKADGLCEQAERFLEDFPNTETKNVLMYLKDNCGEIIGAGYYHVDSFRDTDHNGKTYDGLGAWSANIHIRPDLEISLYEKNQFVNAVLASMKQAGVIFASFETCSFDYNIYMYLIKQGVTVQGRENATDWMLIKKL